MFFRRFVRDALLDRNLKSLRKALHDPFLACCGPSPGFAVTRFEENACKRVGEARFTALQQLREKAAQLQVDFMVIAGDVFDDHTISRSDASRAFPILESSRDSCPVFMIPGNHDPLVPGGVWDRDPWLREQPHLRIHFLRKAEPVAVPNLSVTIYPCPLRQRRSMDDPTAWMEKHPRQGRSDHPHWPGPRQSQHHASSR